MNIHDSDRMSQVLMSCGLQPVDEPKHAGVIIINTCSVRAKPEHKALSEAGRYKHARESRGAKIIMAGCVARQEGEKLLSSAPWLDAVIGPDSIGRLGEIVRALDEGEGPLVSIEDHTQDDPRFVPLGKLDKGFSISRFVTVMKGCNNFCSYCIVPFVRGREVSRPSEEILQEVQQLAKRGVREVTLLGQNVNSYKDVSNGMDFPDLLALVDRYGSMDRIRFTTSHPKDLDEKLMDVVQNYDRVMEHFHLAMQSGSDKVLKRMRRGYTSEQFVQKALALRKTVPGISITTDLIVGFPGETEDDFQDTLEVVRKIKFDGAFSFKYSPRPGTLAQKEFDDDVDEDTKQQRLEILQELLSELEHRSLENLEGRTMQVMTEGTSLRNNIEYTGRTRCNRVVNFTSSDELSAGQVVDVRIKEARGHTLWGRKTL